MLLCSKIVLSEDALRYARPLTIPCEAAHHLLSPHYLTSQYIPQARLFVGVWEYGPSSWCGWCWHRYLILKAGQHLAWPNHVGINAGWKAWLTFAREATGEQVKQAWKDIDEMARKAVDDIDRRPLEQQIA